jgi:hypothetical protein
LVEDDKVVAKIISVNAYGESVLSTQGSGAEVQIVPDAPINIANDPTTTSETTIRFTWNAGASDGGSPVLDYTVFYD